MAAPIPGKRPQRALTYRRHCALGGVEILSGHAVQHRYPRHFHDTMGIAVIHGGRELCWSRGAEREFTGGDIALFNAGEIHDGRPGGEQGWTYDMLHVEPARMHALLGVRDGAGSTPMALTLAAIHAGSTRGGAPSGRAPARRMAKAQGSGH